MGLSDATASNAVSANVAFPKVRNITRNPCFMVPCDSGLSTPYPQDWGGCCILFETVGLPPLILPCFRRILARLSLSMRS